MGAASQELTERAKLLIAERRYPEAVRACRRALLSDPEHVEVRLLLGEALLALERYDEVRVEMIALSRKAPLRGEVHRLLGEAYLRDHRPMQAIQSLRHALELDPEDESASELLAEAADETAPVSTTIERWFADEADPTVETDSPAWEEVHTPVPGQRPATLPSETPPPPKVQIDPSFAPSIPRAAAPARPTEASSSKQEERQTNPSRPREVVRSRKPTAMGFGAPTDPFAPPPRSPRVEPESPATPGRLAPLPSPGFGAPPRPAQSAEPLSAELTHAARPSSIRDPREPATDDLDLVELDSSEEPVLDLPGAPTNARPPAEPHDRIYDIDDFADEETAAFASSAEGLMPISPFPPGPPVHAYPPAPLEPLEPPTIARFETPPIDGGYGPPPPPPMAPPGPAPEPYLPPPPLSAIAEPELLPPPARAPSPPPAAAPARAREKAIRTERVGRDRRSLLVPIVGGVGALFAIALTAGLIVWLVLGASEVAEVRERAAAAGDSGARADLEAVIEEIGDGDEPELVALEARLLATLTLEHDLDRAAEAQAALARIPSEERPTDAAIAAALLAIERGEAAEATQLISGLTAEGEQIAEGLRTRALATLALGRWDQAAGAAMQAMETRPGAPRHVALYALALHRHERSAEAIALLEAHPARNGHPALRATLARVLSESTRDPERALIEATAVIDELGGAASAHELAVAHLVRATQLASRGEGAAAAVAARAAAEHPPPWDPTFGEQLVETFLAAGAAEDANRRLLALGPPVAGTAPARALLTARVALAVGDLDRAEQALTGAGPGLRQSLVSAQVFEARGQLDRARPLYEQAISDPGPEGRRARVRLAAMAMRDGNAARAIELLEPALAAATADLELVPLLARAYLARDREDDASRILTAALSRRADAAELLAARGALELHRGDHAAALASLRQASEARPNDPDLSADLGDAARLAGEATAARAAYDAAIAQRADHPRALIGLARLALAGHALDEAAQRLEAAAATGQEQLEVARLRAELFVTRGDGALGVAALEPLARRFDDAAIWTALGDLQAQAELDRDASRSFDRALRADRGYPEALLGRSLIQIRLGSIGGATNSIEEAEEQARARGMTEALAPRIAVAKGRIRFEQASFDRAIELARQALAQDPRCAGAHLLIANAEIERGASPIEALRAATTGDAPPPEALGRLASRIGRGEEACRLAARYLEVAPRGYDAPDVREVANGCR